MNQDYTRESTEILLNMIQALSSPLSQFLNTEEDTQRLEAAKREIKRRNRRSKGRK